MSKTSFVHKVLKRIYNKLTRALNLDYISKGVYEIELDECMVRSNSEVNA